MNLMTKDEARSIITNLDLKPISSYVACVQRDYAKVMSNPKRAKKIKPVVDSVVETESVVETAVEQVMVDTIIDAAAESAGHIVVLEAIE
jgi:hypothetical protein